MLRDPIRALEVVRRVCRGRMILLETVIRPLDLPPAPLARLDARRDGSERFVFNRRSLQKALELAGWVVEESRRSYETDRGREPVRMNSRSVGVLRSPPASAAAAPPRGHGH